MPKLTGTLKIDRSGGFAGLKAGTSVEVSSLDATQRTALEALFAGDGPSGNELRRDGYLYHLTTTVDGAERSIDAGEDQLPPGIGALVKDTIPRRF